MTGALACLLFAVNVGGRKVPSTELRALAGELGFAGARTLANSGNLVVGPTSGEATAVARHVHDAVAERFGVDSTVVALSRAQLAAIVAANPLPDVAREDPAHLLVCVGERPVDAAGIADLAARWTGTERLAAAANVLYIAYPGGVGRSKLTTAVLTRAAGTPVTGRNWNTITRLLAMVEEAEGAGS